MRMMRMRMIGLEKESELQHNTVVHKKNIYA
jgi:hypothetical protein